MKEKTTKVKMCILLKEIDVEEDIMFLYELLKERPEDINISHKKLPSYIEHKIFVSSNPYALWFIIWKKEVRVGSIYKTRLGELGIFIKKEFQHQGIAKTVIPLVYCFGDEKNIANINPLNKKSIDMFEKLGFKHIQNTYKLDKEV